MAASLAAMIAFAGFVWLGLSYRSVLFASARPVVVASSLTALGVGLIVCGWVSLRSAHRAARRAAALTALGALLALGVFAHTEHAFRSARTNAFATPGADLRAVGRHVVVGYRSAAELKRLIAAGAIGGVFVTARNAQGRSASALAAEIAEFQELAKASGIGKLVITTDQEGGMVSRLSPPLPRPRALSQLIAGGAGEADRIRLVRAAAAEAGRDLARLGVTLNFAPVVDIDFGIRNAADRYSRIGERAISSDPAVVAGVARAYCEGLASAGVRCTLKHFPGLGRVAEDTHVAGAELEAPLADLERSDWLPFREVLASGNAAVMVGHVGLPAIERDRPASTSRALIGGVLRDAWRFDGLVVTDDLTMAAASMRPGGIGASAVESLAAGADLLLVSFDIDQVYEVLASLLQAKARGDLSDAQLSASAARINRMR